jgi:hypothetical protein
MRIVLATFLAALISSPALAGSIVVKNQSAVTVTQSVAATSAFVGLANSIAAGAQSSVAPNIPPGTNGQPASFGSVTYTNAAGKGCRFALQTVPSGSVFVTTGSATPVNGGVCSGSRVTAVDYIFTIQ